MPININFNACDNSPECSGKSVCPTGAIYWDAVVINALGKEGSLCIDNSKCISCGQCVGDDGCPVGAIILAQTDDELAMLTKDIAPDIEKVKALFVERYGAEPIDEGICISLNELPKMLEAGVTIVEEFANWSIQCLLSSIPIETIIQSVRSMTGAESINFLKCDCTNNRRKEDKLPSLKVFRDGNLIAQVDGVYSDTQFRDLTSALQNSLDKIRRG